VCRKELTLRSARKAVQDGWKAAYKRYIEDRPASRDMKTMDDDEVVE
jgi:hypothetical protein